MRDVLAVRRYPDVLEQFSWEALWDLFDGNREWLNVAHECVDRHVGKGTALRIQFADGRREEHDFGALAEWSSRFAHYLEQEGVERAQRVAIMLEPSLAFYGAVFGTMKRGAIAVPLFTLFGPEGVALRIDDCRPRMLVVEQEVERWRTRFPDVTVVAVHALAEQLRTLPARYSPRTAPDDVALFQYTSGTTRALPKAVRHTHRSVVTLMVAALYGLGLRAGDRYFCPSSPAWGHGLWHGTVAPLALGVAVGSYSGKFRPERIVDALHAFDITNLAAAPTVYRMIRESGAVGPRSFAPEKLSFTGEPMDDKTWEFVERTFGLNPCSMYGSTEVGVIIVDYPGFEGYEVRRGALGKPAPGWEVAVVDDAGPLPPGDLGEIAVRRRGEWFRVKDRGYVDGDGYFFHAGRSDDVIISAGWTMSAVEIEQALLAHPDVLEAAVIGVPDELRGQIPKACIVAPGKTPSFVRELQEFVKERLSKHEYPRLIELIDELPKTPAGKIDRNSLRERLRR